MSDLRQAQLVAIEVLKDPPPVQTKLAALDALDRLALNPSGWFTERTLDQLTEARKAIITDRWERALESVENARLAIEVFIRTLRESADGGASAEHHSAVERANAELRQCVLVLSWLDRRPAW
ncbi:MAG: hypothetical protein IT384_22140 [Deltaproteobacteria bacterium]|nr:hypothetical protein [Deltaproteobacteria bacterium]